MHAFKTLCRWIDRKLCDASIPCESFGWRTISVWVDDFGVPQKSGRWHTNEAERDRFYAWNRELTALACQFRKWGI